MPPGNWRRKVSSFYRVQTCRAGLINCGSAYEAAVATADPADVRVASSTRVTDFVNRSMQFDCIYVYPPLLAACCSIIGRPFKLSNTCSRTLNPGAAAQELHADVKYGVDGWPLVGYIWMVDAFDAENGATRFVSGSHRWGCSPSERPGETAKKLDNVSLACGPAGSLIVLMVRYGTAIHRIGQRAHVDQCKATSSHVKPILQSTIVRA